MVLLTGGRSDLWNFGLMDQVQSGSPPDSCTFWLMVHRNDSHSTLWTLKFVHVDHRTIELQTVRFTILDWQFAKVWRETWRFNGKPSLPTVKLDNYESLMFYCVEHTPTRIQTDDFNILTLRGSPAHGFPVARLEPVTFRSQGPHATRCAMTDSANQFKNMVHRVNIKTIHIILHQCWENRTIYQSLCTSQYIASQKFTKRL